MASEGWEREVLASIDRAIWEKPRLGDVRNGWKAVTPSQATVEQQPMAGSPRRLNDSALTPRDAQRYSNSAFPPRAFRRVHDSAQTHHTHSRPATERSPGIEHVPSQTRQLQEQVQLQSQALDRLEAEVEALHWEHGISQRPSLVPYRGMSRVLLADALAQAPCSQTMSRIQFHQLLAAWVCRKLTRAAVDVIFYQARSKLELVGGQGPPGTTPHTCSCGCKCMATGLTLPQLWYALLLVEDRICRRARQEPPPPPPPPAPIQRVFEPIDLPPQPPYPTTSKHHSVPKSQVQPQPTPPQPTRQPPPPQPHPQPTPQPPATLQPTPQTSNPLPPTLLYPPLTTLLPSPPTPPPIRLEPTHPSLQSPRPPSPLPPTCCPEAPPQPQPPPPTPHPPTPRPAEQQPPPDPPHQPPPPPPPPPLQLQRPEPQPAPELPAPLVLPPTPRPAGQQQPPPPGSSAAPPQQAPQQAPPVPDQQAPQQAPPVPDQQAPQLETPPPDSSQSSASPSPQCGLSSGSSARTGSDSGDDDDGHGSGGVDGDGDGGGGGDEEGEGGGAVGGGGSGDGGGGGDGDAQAHASEQRQGWRSGPAPHQPGWFRYSTRLKFYSYVEQWVLSLRVTWAEVDAAYDRAELEASRRGSDGSHGRVPLPVLLALGLLAGKIGVEVQVAVSQVWRLWGQLPDRWLDTPPPDSSQSSASPSPQCGLNSSGSSARTGSDSGDDNDGHGGGGVDGDGDGAGGGDEEGGGGGAVGGGGSGDGGGGGDGDGGGCPPSPSPSTSTSPAVHKPQPPPQPLQQPPSPQPTPHPRASKPSPQPPPPTPTHPSPPTEPSPPSTIMRWPSSEQPLPSPLAPSPTPTPALHQLGGHSSSTRLKPPPWPWPPGRSSLLMSEREFLLLFKPCTSSRLTPADVHIAFHRARSETSLLGEGLAPCGSACSCSCGCKCMTPGLTHDQFLFALTLIADKLGVPVRMTRAAKEPRKTESAGQQGGDLLARVKHVFAFYALCGGGTDETRLGRAEWRQWLRDAGLVSDAGPPAGLPGAALDGLFRRALLPGERGLTLAEFLDAVQPVALALRVSAQQVQQRLVAGGAPALLDHDQLLFLQLAASSTVQQQGQKGQGRVGGGHGGKAWRLIWGWGPWALLDKITASMGKHGY